MAYKKDYDKEAAAQERAERLKEITDLLESGIKNVFDDQQYQDYLKALGKFHNYSANNTMLIVLQKPDATRVASYTTWKGFDRQVQKGQKGMKIYAPMMAKNEYWRTKKDPVTKDPIIGPDGKPEQELVKKGQLIGFKLETVFDISQTEGKELPNLSGLMVDELTGNVDNYDTFFAALESLSPVPIAFENIESSAKGYYNHADKRIAIQEGMSEIQTIKTAIHEIAHAKLHDINLNAVKMDPNRAKDSTTKEVEAESVAFTVCSHFGIDTSDYSFGYVATWGSGKDMPELKKSLELIRNTSHELIDSIDNKVLALSQSQEQQTDRPKMRTLTDCKEYLAKLCKKFNDTRDPEQYRDAEAAYRMLQKRLNKLIPEMPDNNDGFKALVEAAAQSDSFQSLRENMAAIEKELARTSPHLAKVTSAADRLPDQPEEKEGFRWPYAEYEKETEATGPLPVAPVVTILESDHPQLEEGRKMDMYEANELFAYYDREVKAGMYNGNPGDCPIEYRIDYTMEGEPHFYEGNQVLGAGEGSISNHMESFCALEQQKQSEMLTYHPSLAEQPDFQELQKALAWKQETLLPYLAVHENLDKMEMWVDAALKTFREDPIQDEYQQSNISYLEAAKSYVEQCRSCLNTGNEADMFHFPDEPNPQDYIMPELKEYGEKVRAEIAAEAKEAGITVEELMKRDEAAIEAYRAEFRQAEPDSPPSVADLESKVAAGETISLYDLANAQKAERRAEGKKPSVRDGLQAGREAAADHKPPEQSAKAGRDNQEL